MNGQNAKTNFPNQNQNKDVSASDDTAKNVIACDDTAASALSSLLRAKLRKCCRDPSPSLTCLRLDADNSHIGVWQKKAGRSSESSWVVRVKLGKKQGKGKATASDVNGGEAGKGAEEEDRVAKQMIEELLNWNYPCSSSASQE